MVALQAGENSTQGAELFQQNTRSPGRKAQAWVSNPQTSYSLGSQTRKNTVYFLLFFRRPSERSDTCRRPWRGPGLPAASRGRPAPWNGAQVEPAEVCEITSLWGILMRVSTQFNITTRKSRTKLRTAFIAERLSRPHTPEITHVAHRARVLELF